MQMVLVLLTFATIHSHVSSQKLTLWTILSCPRQRNHAVNPKWYSKIRHMKGPVMVKDCIKDSLHQNSTKVINLGHNDPYNNTWQHKIHQMTANAFVVPFGNDKKKKVFGPKLVLLHFQERQRWMTWTDDIWKWFFTNNSSHYLTYLKIELI